MKSLFFKVINSNQLILLIFFLTHILLMIFIGNFTGFAPDEYGYAEVLKFLYEENQSTKNFLVWANSDILFLQLLYLPAKAFISIGISEVISLRLQSIFLITLTLRILVTNLDIKRIQYVKCKFLIISGFYLPSFFLWTTLGLRESFLMLWLTLIMIYSFKLQQSQNFRFVIPIGIGIYGLSQTKLYLYVLTAISFIIVMLINTFMERKVTLVRIVLLLSILSPLAFNSSYLRQVYIVSNDVIRSFQQPAESKSTSNEQNDVLIEESTKYQFKVFFKDLENQSPLLKIIKALHLDKVFISNDLKSTANSRKEFSRPKINDPPAIMLSAIKFLSLPFPLIDNGSLFLNMVSVEAPIWYLLYFFAFFQIIGFRQRNQHHFSSQLTILVMLFNFVIFSALFEINLGTSLRHRSILLILILNLFVVIQNYKSSKVISAKN